MTDEVVAPGPAVIEQNTSHVVGVLAEALAAKLTEELGWDWDWEGERFEGVCMRGGSVDVPSGEQVIRELSESLASVVAALPNIAVVELPEPTGRHTLTTGVEYTAYEDNPADSPVIAWHDGEVSVDCHIGGLSKDGATDLARSLLAAARAAGVQA